MKQDVNYILHHKNVYIRMMEDNVSCIDMSIYNALFLIWNRCDFDSQLSINRNDVMKLAKVGNANTYTKSLKTLHEKKYIEYKPSNNPLIGSKVTIIRCDKGSDKGTAKSSDISSGASTDKGGDTLYKQYNNLTNKQINNILAHANSLSKSELIIFIDSLNSEKIKEEINQRQNKFKESLRVHLSEYGKEILNEFFLYWTEHGANDKKMRFEKQVSFDLKRRLDTWRKNNKNFNNGKSTITAGQAKPKFRKVFSNLANQHEQAEVSDSERELFEDTEYTEVE